MEMAIASSTFCFSNIFCTLKRRYYYEETRILAKSEWGTKRMCQGCGVRFFDLHKNPAVCPACNTEVVIQSPKPKRTVTPVKTVEVPVKDDTDKKNDDNADDDSKEFDSVVLDIDEDDDEDDDDIDLIEDTSDLSGDNGMDEVKEHMSNDTTDNN
jgi:hypothetical protein